MPVILPRGVEERWLDRAVEPAEALELLAPYPSEHMRSAEASMLVNAVANDDLRLFDPSE
jgi:putative SOS response-associated peptidase YedK